VTQVKVSSDVGAAHDAVSGFVAMRVDDRGEHVAIGASNISGMQAGARIANETLKNVSELIAGAKSEAAKVAALAAKIESRDSRDASGWSETA
jgi:hypothetical protein